MNYIIRRNRAVFVVPQWNGHQVRGDGEEVIPRNITILYNIYSEPGPDLAIAEADEALALLSERVIMDDYFRESSALEQISNRLWQATVEYGYVNTSEVSFSFDTTGGTQKITQSIKTIASYASPSRALFLEDDENNEEDDENNENEEAEPSYEIANEPSQEPPDPNESEDGQIEDIEGMLSPQAPNHHGAIGVSGNNVEGCDVLTPALSFSMTAKSKGVSTLQTINNLSKLTAHVNSKPFLGFAAGEVLFCGASGNNSFDNGEMVREFVYNFKVSPNAYNLKVDDIVIDFKLGWDYLWVMYEDVEDESACSIVKKPIAAYVERVYEFADLNILLQSQ